MIKPTKLLIVIALLSTSNLYASTLNDSTYHKRLYYLCKAWGHAKYHHSEIAKGLVSWNEELLETIGGIKNAENNNVFNDQLLLMLQKAGEMDPATGTLPEIPDSLNNITDYSWIQNQIYSSEVRGVLDTIRARSRSQGNVYVTKNHIGSPIFTSDSTYHSDSDYPSEAKRILAMFKYWNIINYFFPYKSIMDQNWDSTLVEYIPQIVGATDALSYHLAFKKFTTKIDDSHAYFTSPTFIEWMGNYLPPFKVRYIENEMVITKVLEGITEVSVGDVITKIDGIDIDHLRDSLRPYAHGSNNIWKESLINTFVIYGKEGSFSVTVDNGSNTHTETLERNTNNYSLYWKEGESWETQTVNGCMFGIVDMGLLEQNEVASMFNELWDTDAIIFDIRSYPNETLWSIVNYIYLSSIHIATFTKPDTQFPGNLYWQEIHIGSGTFNPYMGKIIILFDERTMSQAEYTCMGLEQSFGTVKIGSTTAAADGNISRMYLPGKIQTNATFFGVYYPDYTPTQRIGIIPDYEVIPTIAGIREGKDEVLDFALNFNVCGNVGIDDIDEQSKIEFYPNPATDKINYKIDTDHPIIIEIFDIRGSKLKSKETNLNTGTIDISNLATGIYFVKIISDDQTITRKIIKE